MTVIQIIVMVKNNVTKKIVAIKKKMTKLKKKPIKITKPVKMANTIKLIEADVEISPVATAKIERTVLLTNDTGGPIIVNYKAGQGGRSVMANISKTDMDGRGVSLCSGDQLSITLHGTLIF